MPHIHVLYAGGTIGMNESAEGRTPASDLLPRLRAAAGARLDSLAGAGITWTLESLEPPIDSAEATPRTWRHLAQRVRVVAALADGIVLLHGTDTLSACGSALSFALHGLAKPVVLTGAQHPLGDPAGHAADNVLLALRAAAQPALQEVAIAFGGQVMRANRSLKWSSAAPDAFMSPNWPLLGEVATDGALRIHAAALLAPGGQVPAVTAVSTALPSIGILRVHPGLEVERIEAWLAVRPLDGLVLHTYGSGNAPVTGTPLVRVLARCIDSGAVVVNVSQCPHGRVEPRGYASASPLADAGVIGAADMTADCAFAKLDWLCGHLADPAMRADQFATALCGEASF